MRQINRITAGFVLSIAMLSSAENVFAKNRAESLLTSIPPEQKSLCDGLTFVPVTYGGRDFVICLKSKPNDELEYIISDAIGFDIVQVPMTIALAKMIITNKLYRPLHKQIMEWGGVGFEKMRIRTAEKAFPQSIGSNNLLSMQSGNNSITLSKNKDFRELGYIDRALALLNPVLARYPGTKKRLSGSAQWEWTSFTLAKAGTLMRQGRLDEVVLLYKDFESQPLIAQDLKANTSVNLAAYLAEAGRYEEALSALDLAETAHGAAVPSYDNVKISGSDREFMWIRACALHGMGKRDEAKLLTDKLYVMPDQAASYLASMTPTSFIKLRLAFCIEDSDALASLVQQSHIKNSPLPSYATVFLQQGYQFDYVDRSALLQRVRDDPRLRDVLAQVEQVAPEQMPAINVWRTAPVMPRARKQ